MNYVINLRKKRNHAVFTRMCSICNEFKIPTDYRNDYWGNFMGSDANSARKLEMLPTGGGTHGRDERID